MQVRTYPQQARGWVRKSTLLSCYFTSPRDTKLEDIAVRWAVKSPGALRTVYSFDGNRTECDRKETFLDLSLLENGNASLYLKDITVEDEGEYTCTVLITPHVGHSKIALKVTAKPYVSLEPQNTTYFHGEIKTFFCIVQNYYPQEIELNWLVSGPDKEWVLPKTYCTSDPALNTDGTYSVKSQIALVLNESDSGATTYICEVTHVSLEEPARGRTSIFLAPSQAIHTDTGFIVGVAIGCVLVTGMISVLFSVLYQKRLAEGNNSRCTTKKVGIIHECRSVVAGKTDADVGVRIHYQLLRLNMLLATPYTIYCLYFTPFKILQNVFLSPSTFDDVTTAVPLSWLADKAVADQGRVADPIAPLVSPIILPALVIANEKITFTCNINGFRPKPINIQWYIDRPKQGQRSRSIDTPLLCGEDITHQAQHLVTKHGSVFSATSQLFYTPTVQDDGATLVCEVEHKALHATVRQKEKINITARPKKCYITSWPLVPQLGERLVLSCIVEKFYPMEISLTWLKNGQLVTDVTSFGPFLCEDDYCSIWSQTELLLTEEDDGLIYTCLINHMSFGKIEELNYEINLKGTPPEVQWIIAEPQNPTEGEEVMLRCKISNFSPPQVTVNWFRNGVQLGTGVCNSLCVASARGLHSMWSMLRFPCQAQDHGSIFMCQVNHTALKNCEERSYTLSLSGKS
ncbi:hypothetical protein XELAEV_18046146mg [Xenopus laevis]|uniref:Ig-like domain-containing protein n=1 Tax=Xenopus laevis TaxID=8355 RepID=A0A974BT32_XENLA|nr:hypothetical protein XELAEV_18046146mg [Xenopus laevis]